MAKRSNLQTNKQTKEDELMDMYERLADEWARKVERRQRLARRNKAQRSYGY